MSDQQNVEVLLQKLQQFYGEPYLIFNKPASSENPPFVALLKMINQLLILI